MNKRNRTKLLDRQYNNRDARLFIIATEGRETEKQYFSMFHDSRIKIEILPTGEDPTPGSHVYRIVQMLLKAIE